MRPHKSIRWFNRRARTGTLYLMQDVRSPRLVKIGFRTRRTHTRRNEPAKQTRDDLTIIYTVSMPHAYFAEQRMLKRMRRRWFGVGCKRGSEWFVLRSFETIDTIAKNMLLEAKVIRRIAKLKCAWPTDTHIREYRSPHLKSRAAAPVTHMRKTHHEA